MKTEGEDVRATAEGQLPADWMWTEKRGMRNEDPVFYVVGHVHGRALHSDRKFKRKSNLT